MRLNSQFETKFFENRRSSNTDKLNKAVRNAASGKKLLTASDNVAGSAILQTKRAQIRGLEQARRNMQDGMGLLQQAEGGLKSVNEDLMRINELSMMASNDTMTDDDRRSADEELKKIIASIQDTADSSKFNTKQLLGPKNSGEPSFEMQIGSNIDSTMKVSLLDVSPSNLGLDDVALDPIKKAVELMEKSKQLIATVSDELTKVGSMQSVIEHNLNSSQILQTNITKFESNIEDADMGKEIMEVVKGDVISQALDSLHQYTSDQRQSFEKTLFE